MRKERTFNFVGCADFKYSLYKDMKKILIVDDEQKMVEVLSAYLTNAGYEPYGAYTGMEALKIVQDIPIDLVILDLMLPDISGERICQIIRKKCSVPIIMLTAKVEEDDMVKGLALGADDYIMKPFSPRNVVARIEAVLRRSTNKQKEETCLSIGNGYLKVDFEYRVLLKNEKEVSLTPTEYRIFELFVKSPNRVFSREQIIAYALENEYDGYDRGIDTFVKKIRKKIEPNVHEPRYIQTVYGIGYKFVP